MKVLTKMGAFHTSSPTNLQLKIFITSNINSSNRKSSVGHTAKTSLFNIAIRRHLISSSNRNTRKTYHMTPTLLKWHNQITIKMMLVNHNLIFLWIRNNISSNQWLINGTFNTQQQRICRNRCHQEAILLGILKEIFLLFHKKEKCPTKLVKNQRMEQADHITTETKQ